MLVETFTNHVITIPGHFQYNGSAWQVAIERFYCILWCIDLLQFTQFNSNDFFIIQNQAWITFTTYPQLNHTNSLADCHNRKPIPLVNPYEESSQ